MDRPKYLYHGTTARAAKAALREGIRPRGHHGRTNWKRTIESNPDAVYLTDAYPLYFALNAGNKGAVLQIDVDRLNDLFLVPDEDVLEQAGRGQDGIDGGMVERTRTYRDRLTDYIASDKWLVSLRAMGTCASLVPIPPSAITAVAYVDFNQCRHLAMTAGDAMICLGNYRFCAPKYRGLTTRLFGLPDNEVDEFGINAVPPVTDDMDERVRNLLTNMAAGRKAHEDALAADFAKVTVVNLDHSEAA